MSKLKWSFSSLQVFETCSTQYKSKYIDKNYVEPPQEHLIHGIESHAALEARIRDKTPLPDNLAQIEPYLVAIEKLGPAKVLVEQKLGLTEALQATEFFADDVWWRGVVDALYIFDNGTAICLDHKMGKRKNDFTQLQLFACAVFAAFPEVQRVKMVYGWWKYIGASDDTFKKENAERRVTDSDTMSREDTQKVWQKLLPRVERLSYAVENDAWFEKPSGLCKKYCYHPTCQYRGRGSK
jgi:hypothetical protein